MLSPFRAGLVAAAAAACLAVACFSATAANKPFTNDDLTSSAVELEAQIKSDAGTPAKTVDQLKHDADAAFAKNDFRTGMLVLGQIVAAAPNDAATWLRLAHTIQQIRPGNDSERAMNAASESAIEPPCGTLDRSEAWCRHSESARSRP